MELLDTLQQINLPSNAITLFLFALTPLTYLNKTFYHHSEILFWCTAQNLVICIQEARHFPFFPFLWKSCSHSSHPDFHLFHYTIYIHTEKPRRHDATSSYTDLFKKHSLSTTFTLTQTKHKSVSLHTLFAPPLVPFHSILSNKKFDPCIPLFLIN